MPTGDHGGSASIFGVIDVCIPGLTFATTTSTVVPAARRSGQEVLEPRDALLPTATEHQIASENANRLERRRVVEEFVTAWSSGTPGALAVARHHRRSRAINKVYGEVAPSPHNSLATITREPLGVVGAVIPWNSPCS